MPSKLLVNVSKFEFHFCVCVCVYCVVFSGINSLIEVRVPVLTAFEGIQTCMISDF